jgi:opacity protein-like surface antigen
MSQRLVLFFTLIALSATSLFSQSDVKPRYFIGYSNLQGEGLPNKNDPDNIISPDFLDRRSTLHGVNAEATLPIQNFGITGDFSFNRNKQSSDFSNARQSIKTDVFYFVGGPSFQFRNQTRFEPFVRLMGGAARTNFNVSTERTVTAGTLSNDFDTGSTDLAVMVGGGVDMRVNDRITLRVLQVDYAPIFLGDRAVRVLGQAGALVTTDLTGQRQDNVRFSFGVTF